jgi:hypothetical protein
MIYKLLHSENIIDLARYFHVDLQPSPEGNEFNMKLGIFLIYTMINASLFIFIIP